MIIECGLLIGSIATLTLTLIIGYFWGYSEGIKDGLTARMDIVRQSVEDKRGAYFNLNPIMVNPIRIEPARKR